MIRENAIPFKLQGEGKIPNKETQKVIENIEKGVNLESVTIEQLKAEFEALKAQNSVEILRFFMRFAESR